MRILVVNWQDGANPRAGGAEIHLHEVFGRLARWGHDVTVLVSGWKGATQVDEADGMEIHRVGSRHSFPLHARRYYRRVLAARGFDVIVEDLNKVPLFTPGWGGTPVVPLVHHLFGRTAFREANPVLAAATVLLELPLPRVFRDHTTIAVSESTRGDLVDRGFRRERIVVIPNGVDAERFRPEPGLEPFPDPTILYMGRLQRYKRVDLILRALAVLRDRGVDARLLVAGKGSHQGALEELAGRLRLGERAHFLGFVPDDRKVELLQRAWVHCLTSPKEGWGIVNLEAAAAGTPTVASDAPGLRDSVRHGETGLLVPHGNVEALADGLQRLLTDGGLRQELARGARAFAGEFGWDASARGVEAVLVRTAARESGDG